MALRCRHGGLGRRGLELIVRVDIDFLMNGLGARFLC